VGNGCAESFNGLAQGDLHSSRWDLVVDVDFTSAEVPFEALVNGCVVGTFSVPGKGGKRQQHAVAATFAHPPGRCRAVGPALRLEVRATRDVPSGAGNYLLVVPGNVTLLGAPAATATSTATETVTLSVVAACPSGHPLVDFAPPGEGLSCDACGRGLPAGASAQACRACDFDLCAACASVAATAALAAAPAGEGARAAEGAAIAAAAAAPLQEGDLCVLASGYEALHDAAGGPLVAGGAAGAVSEVDGSDLPLCVNGWWYARAALCRPAAPNAAPPAAAAFTARLAVGDRYHQNNTTKSPEQHNNTAVCIIVGVEPTYVPLQL
jgi:hypothetical protein